MNVLFISPNFPPSYALFCTSLRARGATVLALGDAPYAELRPELRAALSEYVHLPSLERYDDAYRAVAGLIYRYGRIDHIDSLNEHWLPLEARLRADFNVRGLRPTDLVQQRAKTGMAEVLLGAGLDPPRGEPVQSPEQVRAFARERGFPLIFKPDVGVGAELTFPVRNERELDEALKQPLAGFVVQEFITGRVTSFDGITDHDGRVLFTSSFVYRAGVMELLRDRMDVYYYTRREIPEELDRQGRAMVSAFKLRGRLFHAEFFELADGSFRPLEMNLRPPGGFSLDLINYTFDADAYALWADVVTGRDAEPWSHPRKYHCAHVSRRREKRYRYDARALASMLGPSLVLTRPMPGPLATAMGDDLFIVRHADEQALAKAIALVHETV